jgi:ribosomal protein S12 methylthiotransferase accessory factor YcaO
MYTKRGGVAAYHIVWIGLCLRSVPGVRVLASAVDHSTSKNTHTWKAPQAQPYPKNMICCHTTTLSIHTTVV